MRFVRLAAMVFMQNDRDFVDLSQLYCIQVRSKDSQVETQIVL